MINEFTFELPQDGNTSGVAFSDINQDGLVQTRCQQGDEGAVELTTKAGKPFWVKHSKYIMGKITQVTYGKNFFNDPTYQVVFDNAGSRAQLTIKIDDSTGRDFQAAIFNTDLSRVVIAHPYLQGKTKRLGLYYPPVEGSNDTLLIATTEQKGVPQLVWEEGKPTKLSKAMREDYLDKAMKAFIQEKGLGKPSVKEIKAELSQIKKEVAKAAKDQPNDSTSADSFFDEETFTV